MSAPNTKVFSRQATFSRSQTTKTVTRNGGQPQTTKQVSELSDVTSNGDPISPIKLQHADDFEELKRSIDSGDAYKRDQRINSEVAAQRGHQQYKPDEGVTRIRPTRSSIKVPVQTGSAGRTMKQTIPVQPRSASNTLESCQGQSSRKSVISPKLVKDCNSNFSVSSSPDKMSNYKTELYIPVRRHHGDFDDFFRNRWPEHNSSLMGGEFDHKRQEWEAKLDDMKKGFFDFSPFGDQHSRHYESTNAIQPQTSTISLGPSGNPEFAVRFNVKDFKPEEINVSTKGGQLTIAANHEEKTGNSTSRRQFKRTVDIPADVQIGLMRSTLSKDGILSITAPIRPPNYLPGLGPAVNPALQSSSQITQQHANAVSSMPVSTMPLGSPGSVVTREADTGDALNYSLSIAGYQPHEVTVAVEGRKVTVHAKHDENAGGRKVHNEMTKSFDLPPSVNAQQVRSYIKDGSTLFIEAHLRDDLVGKIHVVPVTHKSF